MPTMSHHVLLIGGHGKVAQYLTPLLLKRSWTVTSLIRAQEQVPTIEKLGSGQPGKLNVLVRSIEDLTSQDDAAKIISEVKPDLIAFSAGAGGKGDASRTFKIDRDAAFHFINAAATFPTISKFLLVSYIGSRRQSAPWWKTSDWEDFVKAVNEGVLAKYYQAKLPADELLHEAGKKSPSLVGISLRPGTLTEEPAGKVTLGKTAQPKETTSRATVAAVADALLAADGLKTSWIDLADGQDEIDLAVQRVIKEGIDAAEGDPVFSN